ncbi:hypothetical protein NPIL_69521 [Nephila pilipes]|uniref:Uncharacterized protein n=1 Tax=Nephila pilipes TaxID=299642 RepID=A0A8X6U6Y9_NEPPI|nr:hypothetical protein NPIL_69521 [Nephila pilipes]
MKRKSNEFAETAFLYNSYKEGLKEVQKENKEFENKIKVNKDAVLIISNDIPVLNELQKENRMLEKKLVNIGRAMSSCQEKICNLLEELLKEEKGSVAVLLQLAEKELLKAKLLH